MKIYTRTGDQGQTSLIGARISKDHLRVQTYGEIDELQACLGVSLAQLREAKNQELEEFLPVIKRVQDDLFVLSANLATLRGKSLALAEEQVEWLEKVIDRYQDLLPPLKAFIRQGGSLPGSWLHFCRAVCRRAERSLVAFMKLEKIDDITMNISLKYLNRLSDLLFILARTVNNHMDETEEELRS